LSEDFPKQGHEELLDALAILSTFGSIVSRQSSARQVMEKGTAAHGNRTTTRFPGYAQRFLRYRADIPSVMAAFGILIFPSRRRIVRGRLIEAMAIGLPVVTTNCDGVLDIVVDSETGIMVPSKDGIRLAEAMNTLLQDTSLRDSCKVQPGENVWK
jgi:glycosyltransferase involved in cell wall biosynthesis